MGITLHVDLVWTDISVFMEHLDHCIDQVRKEKVNGGATVLHPLFGNIQDYVIEWNLKRHWNGTPIGAKDIPSQARIRGQIEIKKYPDNHRTNFDESRLTYYIKWTNRSGSPDETKCWIYVAQFRKDRLKVVVYEEGVTTIADDLAAWLNRRWGPDGVNLLGKEDAPLP